MSEAGRIAPARDIDLEAIERKVAELRAGFLAEHDDLTGLLTRAAVIGRLTRRLARLRREDLGVAVHLVDIDNLRAVNEAHGYDVGDGLIRAVADTIAEAVGELDVVARIGGDSFLVVQDDVREPAQVAHLAGQIGAALDRRFVVKGLGLTPGAAVGCALAPLHGGSVERVLHSAELALSAAQGPGNRVRVRLFEPGMALELQRRRDLERLVREATAKDGFELCYQPVVSTSGGRPVYLEALLRLPRPGGHQSPASFIPIAEDLGLVNRIGAWALRQACAAAATWPKPLGVAVNLSPAQFTSCDLVDIVRDALATSGLPPERLELEITEGLLLKDSETVIAQLDALKELGVSTAMDDFGTGYSSLGYLWRFPFDKLKIDRSFMLGYEIKGRDVADIVRTIVALGHTLGMEVTAEGIETEAQADMLRTLRCDYVQGYLFSRPIPETSVPGYLREAERLQARRALAAEQATAIFPC